MRKIPIALLLAATAFSAQSVFADTQTTSTLSSSDSKPCIVVAKACLDAGFDRDSTTPNKSFWQDCMKPILMGQTVTGVTVDPTTVKDCRVNKIGRLKKDLEDLQQVS